MKKDLTKHIDFLKNRIAALEQVKNSISEDARAEIEGRIGQLRELASDLEAIRDANAEGEEDHSAEMLAQMREVLARLDAVEDSVKNENVENSKNTKNMVKNSKDYERKFYNYVMNVTEGKEFREGIKDFAVKNDITMGDGSSIADLLPAAVLQEINDIFVNHRHRILELVDWTGLPVFKAMWETGNAMGNVWPSALNGQTPSSDPKTEQELELNTITIRPQYVYKYISVDKEMVRASEDEGRVLIRYIVRELLDRLLCTIENLILHGNGQNFLAPTITAPVVDGGGNTIYHAMAYLPNSGSSNLVAICTPNFYITLKQSLLTTLGYYVTDEMLASEFLGVSEVIMTPPGFQVGASFTSGGDLFFMNTRAYKMVGDRRPDEYEDFNLAYNKKEYLTEMWIGGGSITPEFIVIGATE